MRWTILAVALAVSACALRGAEATPVIDVGTFNLLPNTPGQQIQINVSGGDAVQAVNLNIEVGQNVTGPAITAVDVLTGTIFAGNNNGQAVGGFVPLLWIGGTATNSGTVTANGLLVTVTLDTTGFFVGDGPFDLWLKGTQNGDSDFAPLAATITNGFVNIVPEPGSMTLAGVALASLAGVARRYRRRRALA